MKPTGKWARDPLDWYVEPEWCSERLFEVEDFGGMPILDPAMGEGRIFRSAYNAGLEVCGNDIVDRRDGFDAAAIMWSFQCSDFMSPDWALGLRYHHIVCNPPFGLCDERRHKPTFAELCLQRAKGKVVLLLPATWHLGDRRSRWLEGSGLRRIYFLTPRPSMPPGTHIQAGGKPGGGTQDFAWYVWLKGYDGPVETRWLRRDA